MVRSIHFVTTAKGFVVGGNDILMTSDGGASWMRYPLGPADEVVYDVEFPSDLVGYAVGNVVYKTTDGGISWRNLHAPIETGDGYWSVHFANERCGVIQGRSVLYTRDGGDTWLAPHNILTELPTVIRTMAFQSDSVGYIGGYYQGVHLPFG